MDIETALGRLRLSVAEYEAHREQAGDPSGDPDAGWWYAAWGAALVPALREVLRDLPARPVT